MEAAFLKARTAEARTAEEAGGRDIGLESITAVLLVMLAVVVFLQLKKWVSAVAAWSTEMLETNKRILEASTAALETNRRILEQHEKATTAVVSLERRHMDCHLTGAECGRLFVGLLAEFSPHGEVSSWRPLHSRRCVVELQAKWKRSCSRMGLPATEEVWRTLVESAYSRAQEELEAVSVNHAGENIRLEDKVRFFRAQIVEAAGRPEGHQENFLVAQHALQTQRVAGAGGAAPQPGDIMFGDLLTWRQVCLVDFMEQYPGVSPTVADAWSRETGVAEGAAADEVELVLLQAVA